MKTIRTYIEDIIESISKIERYTKNLDFEKFQSNEMVIDAVLRNLEVIGEVASRIPSNVRDKHNDIPWKRMIGLRNIVIHEYFGVDLTIIWKIVIENLPETKPSISELHRKLQS